MAVLGDIKKSPLVTMGQIELIQGDECARAVLGSCIGLAIIDRHAKICTLAHIVLPEACNREGTPGKYADTALPEMLQLLANQRATRSKLIAKFAGGAEMFAKLGPLRIGDENVRMVTDLLKRSNIPILGSDVGGTKGRRIVCSAAGELIVESLGQERIVL